MQENKQKHRVYLKKIKGYTRIHKSRPRERSMDSHGTGFREQEDQHPGVQKNPALPPMTACDNTTLAPHSALSCYLLAARDATVNISCC